MVEQLAAAVFLNYFDRGALSIAAPLLQTELQLSPAQMGILFSAFFWSYAPLQPLAGWLAQRFDVRLVLGGGLALWGLATLLTGFAHGFFVLSEYADVMYKCTAVYHPAAERTIAWNSPTVGIEWPIPAGVTPMLSPRDAAAPHWERSHD